MLRCAEVNYEPSSPHAGLTGEIPTDVADASGTLLFDAGARAWRREIARLFEIDPAWLPPPESPEACGQTASGVVVAAGARDQELYPALRRFAS